MTQTHTCVCNKKALLDHHSVDDVARSMNEEILVSAEGEAASRIDGDPSSDEFYAVRDYAAWITKKQAKGYTIHFLTPYKTTWDWGDGRRERTIILRLLRLATCSENLKRTANYSGSMY